MFGKPKSVLGIDIGTHSVKVVELTTIRGGIMVLHGAILPIPPEQPDFDIGQRIRAYLATQDTRTRHAVIALPASSGEAGESDTVVWQILDRPEIPPEVKHKDLVNTLSFELEDFIAYEPEEAIFDAQVLYSSPGGEGSVILLVIAPRSLVEQRIQIVHGAGLEPISVDLDFFAFERIAEFTGQLDQKNPVLLMEVGDAKTSVGFYQGHRLQAVFDFHAAGRNITSELQRNLHLDLLDAEDAKQNQVWIEHVDEDEESVDSYLAGIVALGPQAGYLGGVGTWHVDAAIENAIDDQRLGICPPLRACFDSYETDFPDAQIANMILGGGTAQLYNFPELLMERFGIQVEKIAYADKVSWSPDTTVVRAVQANEPCFAAAMGLAMKTLSYKLSVPLPEPEEDQMPDEGESAEEEEDDESRSVAR